MSCFGLSLRLRQRLRRSRTFAPPLSADHQAPPNDRETVKGETHTEFQNRSDEEGEESKPNLSNDRIVNSTTHLGVNDDVPGPDTGVVVTQAQAEDTQLGEEIKEKETEKQVEDEEEEGISRKEFSTTDYYASGYCALCRTQLPHNSLPILEKRTEPWEQWERDCRAVLCLDTNDETGHVITNPFHLFDEDFDSCTSVFLDHPVYAGVNLQLKISSMGDDMAYVFHLWCYDVFMWKNRTAAMDAATLYQLAKSLSHEASPWETIGTNATGWLDPPSRIETLIGDLNDEENVMWQPGFLSRLPAEIRAPIWGYVGMRSAYSSFFLVSKETAGLVQKLSRPCIRSVGIAQGDMLCWETIRFFGTDYLGRLTNDSSEKTRDSLLVKEKPLVINVIAGLPGVCALQLVGETWNSPWIGTVPKFVGGQVWYATLQDPDTSIQATFTGLTCLDLYHKTSPQLMWDRPDVPPHLAQLDQLRSEALFLRWQAQLRTRFEFMRYLPLVRGKEAANALTFYCSDVGTIGIAAHFSSTTNFAGYRDGLPTYVPFEPGESLKLLYYRLGRNHDDCPSFVLETTSGRIHHLGPYVDPEKLAPQCRWFPVSAFTYAQVIGISFQNPRREMACVAVHGSPKHRKPLELTACVKSYPTSTVPTLGYTIQEIEDMQDLDREVSFVNAMPGNGLFLSIAKLEGVVRVERCIVGCRIVGLLFDYIDGSKATLGQWYVSETYSKARNEVIYESKDQRQRAQSFSFRLAGEEARKQVVGVEVFADFELNSLQSENPLEFRCWSSTTICWWYSKCYDHLAFSNESTYEIPNENEMWT